MSLSAIIREFDARSAVPVDVNDVVAALRDLGVKDEIYFFPAEMDSGDLRGQMAHWDPDKDWEYPTTPSGTEMKSVAEIYYAREMSDDWQRLVSCKELLHILDHAGACAKTHEAVMKLSEKIALPAEHQDVSDGWVANTDRNGILYAVAVLFPWRARELFLKDGSLSNPEIARIVDLPLRYVQLVMSEQWEFYHGLMIDLPG